MQTLHSTPARLILVSYYFSNRLDDSKHGATTTLAIREHIIPGVWSSATQRIQPWALPPYLHI